MTLHQQVAAKIRGEMAVQGKTVTELAKVLGVSRVNASAKRNVNPKAALTVTDIETIAKWLGLDPADFFTK